jgi:hypothetical protein
MGAWSVASSTRPVSTVVPCCARATGARAAVNATAPARTRRPHRLARISHPLLTSDAFTMPPAPVVPQDVPLP